MYRALVVEDEADEAARLIDLMHRYATAHDISFLITHYTSAMEMLSDQSHYDLLLLDIDLPGINGMEAAELLRVYDEETPIIFVTNLAKYAVKGYEVGACGFIVKPVTMGGLSMALDRALRTVGQNVGRNVMISTDDGTRVVPLSQIIYVEVSGHTLTYHLKTGELLETRGSLGQLEEDLADAPVVRVSKSCLANMNEITRIRSDTLQMSNGDELRISRTRKREIVDKVTDYIGGHR